MELAKIYGICFLVAGGAFLIRAFLYSGKSKKFYWVAGGFIVVGTALFFGWLRLH